MKFRSLLFVPGNDPAKLAKAELSDADVLIPDLEDSVPESQKGHARETVARWLKDRRSTKPVYVRTNGVDTPWQEDDVMATWEHVAGFMVPKVADPVDLRHFYRPLNEDTKLIPLIETAAAVWQAREIAKALPNVLAIAFGSEDFAADMGCTEEEASGFRRWVILGAKAARVVPIDTVYLRVHDGGGLTLDCIHSRDLGYKGRLCLHPKQVATVNRAYEPTTAEIVRAERIVAIAEAAELHGSGVGMLDGMMVGPPMVKTARQLLEKAGLCVS